MTAVRTLSNVAPLASKSARQLRVVQASTTPVANPTVQNQHVAILERAQLVTKRHHGRERIVCGRIETARKVNRLLDELEDIWRVRMQRFGEVLLSDETDSAPTHLDHQPDHQPDHQQGDPR